MFTREEDGATVAYPDSLVGTDSHTTMINGLGVLGWGVGGIEAEAAMLGQPVSMLIPEVVGFKLHGKLPPGATATDLVLTVTEMLRKKKVVGKFVEFYGTGLSSLPLADRATIANMAPEYGATMGFFPVDAETLKYLRLTGRGGDHVDARRGVLQGAGALPHRRRRRIRSSPTRSSSTSRPSSRASPARSARRTACRCAQAKPMFRDALKADLERLARRRRQSGAQARDRGVGDTGAGSVGGGRRARRTRRRRRRRDRGDERRRRSRCATASVVIAAITSCTNTSNPSVMLGAGLLARNAVAKGLTTKPWVKTSLAPGSKVVTDYYEAAGVMKPLEQLGFHIVGYGCTTCIGNSGPLPEPIAQAIEESKLVVAAVLSGNRNFEGRVNPLTRFNYLASPPLVVAYALAGRMDIDLDTRAVRRRQGRPGVPARHLAVAGGSGRRDHAVGEDGAVRAAVRERVRGRRRVARARRPDGRSLRVERRRPRT